MKRTITLVAVLCLLQTLAFGQKKYEMVIEKTDGTETVINVEDIVRTYFRERTELSDLELSASTLSMTVGETTTVEITSGSGEYGVTNLNSSIANATLDGTTITINALAEGNAKIEVTDKQTDQTITIEVTVTASGETEGHAPAGVVAVDLGLPSGTLWANMNVGASAPEDYGDYFAWGETKPKDVYTWETYAYWRDTNGDGSVDKNELVDLGSDIAGKKDYDAATANWGSPWKMPTGEQIEELIDNCTSEWTQENGIYGRKFTGSNGNTIFLPAAGNRWNGEFHDVGAYGYYWSSTLLESGPYNACLLGFGSGDALWYGIYRGNGRSVRPVR